MKKGKNKALWTSLMSLSAVGTSVIAFNVATIESEAVGFGGAGFKTIDATTGTDGSVMSIKFNTSYDNGKGTPQSRAYGGNREFYREVYTPLNKDLPGGFVWYSIIPRDYMDKPLSEYDYSLMLENRQTALGAGGERLVKEASSQSYRLNLKYGSIDPWTGKFKGNNTGTSMIKYGAFKGKRYEWRYLGYTQGGTPVGNPFLPNDNTVVTFNTKHDNSLYWSKRSWIKESWKQSYSFENFGVSEYNDPVLKAKWIDEIFLKEYPEFKSRGNGNYWKDYFMPLSNPEKETGVWLGWHTNAGRIWYVLMITEQPKQPNLRITDYKIFDSEGNLVARQQRNTNYYDVSTTDTFVSKNIKKGETYTIEAKMYNMPDVKKNLDGIPIELEHMYVYDEMIGQHGVYSTPKKLETAQSPNETKLSSGGAATFKYEVTIPEDAKPQQKVEFNARIPGTYFEKGYNTNQNDDTAKLVLTIAPENLGVEFKGFYNDRRQPTDYVAIGEEIWVKYKVTKTNDGAPVKEADLKINLTDTKTVTTNQTYKLEEAKTKDGKVIPDGILQNKGDYAVMWAKIVPNYLKVCTEANIPTTWASKGLNKDPADDSTKRACLANPDNIVVSNVVAKPQTTFLSKTQNSKSVVYTVSYNLTNYNYDKKDKTIPVVITIDGKVVHTEVVPVQSLNTMKVSRVLPAVTVGEGEHVIQVEANPKPRKYVEFKTDALGNEVDPYSDNIGWDKVNVVRNFDDFKCSIKKTSNNWNTNFLLSYWHGKYYYYYDYYGNLIEVPYKEWTYENQNVGFYEKQEIKNIFFRSKYTNDKKGGWVDLMTTKGTIKAGYGFELKIVTSYQTNTFNDTPKPFDYGFPYGRLVSPQYSVVDSTARVKVTMPFTDDSGKPIAFALDGVQSGSWYNNTKTYELEERTVINDAERKWYINENTKDGDYNVRIETEPFYGSYDKPATSAMLCDIQNVTIEVKGSYLDDVKTHIVQ